jgi:hypothetical protein
MQCAENKQVYLSIRLGNPLSMPIILTVDLTAEIWRISKSVSLPSGEVAALTIGGHRRDGCPDNRHQINRFTAQ